MLVRVLLCPNEPHLILNPCLLHQFWQCSGNIVSWTWNLKIACSLRVFWKSPNQGRSPHPLRLQDDLVVHPAPSWSRNLLRNLWLSREISKDINMSSMFGAFSHGCFLRTISQFIGRRSWLLHFPGREAALNTGWSLRRWLSGWLQLEGSLKPHDDPGWIKLLFWT